MQCPENLSNVNFDSYVVLIYFFLMLGKDIEIALTEIRELQNSIKNLAEDGKVKDKKISMLKKTIDELER